MHLQNVGCHTPIIRRVSYIVCRVSYVSMEEETHAPVTRRVSYIMCRVT